MKWMIRKRLESDWMDERDKDTKGGLFLSSLSSLLVSSSLSSLLVSSSLPWVYVPFLKGTSVD